MNKQRVIAFDQMAKEQEEYEEMHGLTVDPILKEQAVCHYGLCVLHRMAFTGCSSN